MSDIQLQVYYKFYFDQEAINNNSYYYTETKEFQTELTKERIKEILLEDGYNLEYLNLIKTYKYLLLKIGEEPNLSKIENEEERFKKLTVMNDNPIKLEEKGNYILFLYIIIDSVKEEERKKLQNDKDLEAKKEANEIKSQFAHLEQMSNELMEIKKQLYHIKNNTKDEYYNFIKCIKKNAKINNQNLSQDISNYELKGNEYELIGRKEEFEKCLKTIENENKICIYGPKGSGKKYFAKNVGFYLEKEKKIFDKIYFIEINEIDSSNPELKTNILIDEICEFNNKQKILIIIYFNEQIDTINYIKEYIYNRVTQKNENNLWYIFTFSLKDEDLEIAQIEFLKDIELTHYNYKEINDIIKLFELYIAKNNVSNKKESIEKAKQLFNKIKDEKEAFSAKEQKNKDNIIEIKNEEKDNNKKNIEQIKISNIFLLGAYIDFVKDYNMNIQNIFIKLILNDDEETKIKIIETIINSRILDLDKKKIENIFLTLSKLSSGIEKNLLKKILNDNDDKVINFIKQKLNCLIDIENNGNEEIFKLRSTLKELIEDIYKDKKFKNQEIEKNIINIIYNYFLSIRYILKNNFSKTANNSSINFNACVENNFWSNKDAEQNQLKIEYKFIDELDSNNIYSIIKNNINKTINNNEEIKKYINDISISLPTLLYFKGNYYLLNLIMDFFEKKFSIKEETKDEKESTKINIPILRLGIFKYWITRNPDYFQNSLTLSNILENQNIHLNNDEKFEYYLSKIFDCMIRKENSFEYYKSECDNLLNIETDEKIKNLNKKRLDDIYSEALNACSKENFYFLLENPLNNNYKTQLNSNFYLTQKLSTIIPSAYNIKFKTIKHRFL